MALVCGATIRELEQRSPSGYVSAVKQPDAREGLERAIHGNAIHVSGAHPLEDLRVRQGPLRRLQHGKKPHATVGAAKTV